MTIDTSQNVGVAANLYLNSTLNVGFGGGTQNVVFGNEATSPVLGGPSSHTVFVAGVDQGGTSGDRRLQIQSESGSMIAIGNDRLSFDATTGYLSVGSTDVVTLYSTGIGIGSAVQEIGLFGATPVVQPSTTGTTAGFVTGSGGRVMSGSTFTGNTGSTAYTIGDIVKALKNLGLLKA